MSTQRALNGQTRALYHKAAIHHHQLHSSSELSGVPPNQASAAAATRNFGPLEGETKAKGDYNPSSNRPYQTGRRGNVSSEMSGCKQTPPPKHASLDGQTRN
ncbi:hypothetical protein RRG08_024706 [Elysia crispata]|uniref:Uncharacterized protein n=1 Tax=Elysia crispata TaxID=231223 RepID=A0AAE0YDD7_9GAST|nr:hypothetical protein RRG08_024706 [Elysia crispata]